MAVVTKHVARRRRHGDDRIQRENYEEYFHLAAVYDQWRGELFYFMRQV